MAGVVKQARLRIGERGVLACFTCAENPTVATAIKTPDVNNRVRSALQEARSPHAEHIIRPIRLPRSNNHVMEVARGSDEAYYRKQINYAKHQVYVYGSPPVKPELLLR